MKQKVALAATLTILLLLTVFLGIVAHTAKDVLNSDVLEQISSLCRLSADQMDSAAIVDGDYLRALRSVASGSKFMFAVYSEDGETNYTNMPSVSDTLSDKERGLASDDKTHTFSRGAEMGGATRLYCVKRLSMGDYLCVSRKAYTLIDAFNGRVGLLLLLAAIICGMVFAIMHMANARTDRLVGSVLRVLTDFSDGDYESRLSGDVGDSIEQVARFNETLGRIQDQVFRQRTRNQALNAVLNNMQSGIMAVDGSLNVILATPVARKLLGVSGQYEGIPLCVASKDIDLDSVFQKSMSQDGVTIEELTAHTAVGGGDRPLKLYVSPVMKDKKVDGAVALIEDVTELRRLEKVRTDFAANVSHEMKTPLTSIKGFVETLQNGAINNPEMAQKFLKIIMLEADRLTRLINDILIVSKLESGTEPVINERVQLDEITDDVTMMLELMANEKKVTIKYSRPPEPVFVIGNRDRVEQMLINLIDNAIKYNKEGGMVTVSLFTDGDNIDLSISDTGIGIPKENIPRLFERFYRVDKGRSRSMGGTGLGLSIVKHIVKSMGGMIEVHSKFGEGTEFLITLKKAPDQPEIEEKP